MSVSLNPLGDGSLFGHIEFIVSFNRDLRKSRILKNSGQATFRIKSKAINLIKEFLSQKIFLFAYSLRHGTVLIK